MNWLIDTEKINSENDFFTKKTSKTLKTVILYVDNNNNIIDISKKKYQLTNNNLITKDELVTLLMENNKHNNITYNSYKIMKFNIDLDIDELEDFIEYSDDSDVDNFTDYYNNINDIINHLKNVYKNIKYEDGRLKSGWYTDQINLYNYLNKWEKKNVRHKILNDKHTKFRRLCRKTNFTLTHDIIKNIKKGYYSEYHAYSPYEEYKKINDDILKIILNN